MLWFILLQIEVLSAEVAALKNLVLTSTPSSPNKHLHPQIDNSNKKDKVGKPFWKTHRRSTSHHQLTKESQEKAEADEHHSLLKEVVFIFLSFIFYYCCQQGVVLECVLCHGIVVACLFLCLSTRHIWFQNVSTVIHTTIWDNQLVISRSLQICPCWKIEPRAYW